MFVTRKIQAWMDHLLTTDPPRRISPVMTGSLIIYAGTFMRYSLAVTPKNYLLFACHFVNAGAQLTQGYRYINWNYWGGRERAALASPVSAAVEAVQGKPIPVPESK